MPSNDPRASSGARYSASVGSSAASVSLRRAGARFSGFFLQTCDQLPPADDDACLGAGPAACRREGDQIGAAATVSRTVAARHSPPAEVDQAVPLPRSTAAGTTARTPDRGELGHAERWR